MNRFYRMILLRPRDGLVGFAGLRYPFWTAYAKVLNESSISRFSSFLRIIISLFFSCSSLHSYFIIFHSNSFLNLFFPYSIIPFNPVNLWRLTRWVEISKAFNITKKLSPFLLHPFLRYSLFMGKENKTCTSILRLFIFFLSIYSQGRIEMPVTTDLSLVSYFISAAVKITLIIILNINRNSNKNYKISFRIKVDRFCHQKYLKL